MRPIDTAFDQWATYICARVRSQMTHDDKPLIFSYCQLCGRGLGAVNGLRIGRCSEAGQPCKTNEEGQKK